jgi:hypothetical protein
MKRRPIKLIRAYAEELPGTVLEVFRKELKDLLGKKKAGIYVLYREGKPYYVGKAGNLPSRIKDHTKDRLNKKWDAFSFYVVGRPGYSKHLESLLLRIVDPKGAHVGGRLQGAMNLEKKFKADLSKFAKALGELKR